MAGVDEFILEVKIKAVHNLEQSLESKPQEQPLGTYTYTLPRLPKEEELDGWIQQTFSGKRVR